MSQDVKVQIAPLLALRFKEVLGRLWMGYFLLTIALIGVPLSVGIYIPLYFLSFLYPAAQKPADGILVWGIGWLMRVQPWLEFDSDLAIPQGGVLLASNHRSHLDVFLLLARVRGIHILAKSSLFYIPFLNVMMKVTGQIPIRRGHLDSFWNAMKIAQKRLKAGEVVHVFPEMTRCALGMRGTNAFMTAPFLAAREAGVPILPIVIEGTDRIWPRGWFGLHAGHKVRVRALPAVDPLIFASAEDLSLEVRRLIDKALA